MCDDSKSSKASVSLMPFFPGLIPSTRNVLMVEAGNPKPWLKVSTAEWRKSESNDGYTVASTAGESGIVKRGYVVECQQVGCAEKRTLTVNFDIGFSPLTGSIGRRGELSARERELQRMFLVDRHL